MKKVHVMCAVIAAGVLAAAVQSQPPTPKPGPEMDQLKKLVGTWDTTMKMGGNEEKGTAVYKMDLGGLWLASTFDSQMMGQKFSGRGFDSYDAGKKKYISVWMDSMSSSPMVSEGTFDAAKKTLTMEGMGPGMDGKPVKHRMTSEMPDDNTMNFSMFMGDSKEPMFTITYKRKK